MYGTTVEWFGSWLLNIRHSLPFLHGILPTPPAIYRVDLIEGENIFLDSKPKKKKKDLLQGGDCSRDSGKGLVQNIVEASAIRGGFRNT